MRLRQGDREQEKPHYGRRDVEGKVVIMVSHRRSLMQILCWKDFVQLESYFTLQSHMMQKISLTQTLEV